MHDRIRAGIAAVVCVALGLASRKFPLGIPLWDKSFGDVIYAVMVGFIVIVVRPKSTPSTIGATTFVICFALELFQLTGIPRELPRALRFVVGSTFAWHDVACYVVGALIVAGLTALQSRSKERA